MTVTTLIRGNSLTPSPWKNGGGVTHEVAVHPAGADMDAFAWRVSIADVAQPGPFSRFTGIDRTLVLLAGKGMHLEQADGVVHSLTQPLAMARFAGEAAIDAKLVDGATRDFNLMVRRGVVNATLQVLRAGEQQTLTSDVALLFCADGSPTIALGGGEARAMKPDDTLRIDAAQNLHCSVTGHGALLLACLHHV